MMGKLREGNHFAIMEVVLSLPLNMALVCISFSQLGIHLVSESIHFHEPCHSFEHLKDCIVRCRILFRLIKSMLPSIRSCRLMFKRETILRVYTCSQKKFFESVTSESVLWLHQLQNSRTLFQDSYRRCGIHHVPPSTRLFLSTSTHHPGISPRNKFSTLRSVCPNDRFSHFRHRFTSLTFDQNIQLSV